jgi:putative ABC transport system substrate-binding protein
MNRRTLLGLAASAAGWPVRLFAQQMPTIGVLSSANVANWGIEALRNGLKEQGFEEGRNLRIIYRAADGDATRLPELAQELIREKVSLIFATGGPVPARTAKAATTTIPIVFAYGGDPVADGLVASLNRPGANVTGATFIGGSLQPKRLEILREIVPTAKTVAFLANPATATLAERQIKEMQAAADLLGMRLEVFYASDEAGIEAAFKAMAQKKPDVLVVAVDPTYGFMLAKQITGLATRYKIPSMYDGRGMVDVGGLISYGAALPDTWRQAGRYVGRILKGEKPQDLPVMQPTIFELVVNLKTAKAIGIEVPMGVQQKADDIIE